MTQEEQTQRWCPDYCPITFRPFFMWIEHHEKGLVPTYGGPYDSYTIPEPVLPSEGGCPRHHIELSCERYDHDEGGWIEGVEDPCLRVAHEETLMDAELMERSVEAQESLKNPVHKVYFRAGMLAARESLARFVESQDTAIAESIRANWWPSLGEDPGVPRLLLWDEVAEETADRIEHKDIDASREALPIAFGFLQQTGH